MQSFKFIALNWTPQMLVACLTRIVYGNAIEEDAAVPAKETPGKWHIGTKNNYWLQELGDHRYEFIARHGTEMEIKALSKEMTRVMRVTILPDDFPPA